MFLNKLTTMITRGRTQSGAYLMYTKRCTRNIFCFQYNGYSYALSHGWDLLIHETDFHALTHAQARHGHVRPIKSLEQGNLTAGGPTLVPSNSCSLPEEILWRQFLRHLTHF